MRRLMVAAAAVLMLSGVPAMAEQPAPPAAVETPAPTSKNPEATQAFVDAEKAYKDKQLDEALAGYKKATDLDPGFGAAWYGEGNVLADQEKYPAARDAYQKAIKLSPREPSYHYALGIVKLKQNDQNGAIVEIRETTKLAPKEPGPWYTLATIYDTKEDKRRAIEAYTTYLRLDPKGPLAGQANHRSHELRQQLDYEEQQRRMGLP